MSTLINRVPSSLKKMPFQKLIIDDQVNEPMVFEFIPLTNESYNTIPDILNVIDPEKVTSLYVSEIFSYHDARTKTNQVTYLVLLCKDINDIFYAEKNYHIKVVQPLGIQQPTAFYAPKYDTPESRSNTKIDFRTTIHWQPDVHTDSLGIASFDFYTEDNESFYTLMIEGVTTDGKIIRHESKLFRQDEEKCP
jgi:hypothetical protein